MIEKFRFTKYEVVFKAGEEGLVLPYYKGSTLRGGFGNAFQRIACAQRNSSCKTCLLKTTCPYVYIFETTPPPGSQALSNYEAIPRPFIIEPPLDTKTYYAPGELLAFNLILIGKAIEYLPYFVVSFKELGKHGMGKGRKEFNLHEIRAVNPLTKQTEAIYAPPDYMIKPIKFEITGTDLATNELSHINEVTINFKTMTRLKFADEFVERIEFHVLIRNLLRRISSLAYFHHDWEVEANFSNLIEKACRVEIVKDNTRWVDWERYSSRQDSRINLGGVVGEVVYQGDLGEFMPLLQLGQYTHVGKAAVFGMGGYEVNIR
ncbi:MAG: CRISPR system precrRNA processing endoribonuclease RAMP protein Cas6 [Bacillota bacterium]|nr:CRISPR system precrRNA processing endoribonuclease RAMP protein Cas6 [Bacillota bacterium]